MAGFGNIQKTGIHSWKLTVSGGFDGSGKRIRHTKTVHVESDNLEQQEKEAKKQLALFSADIEKGQAAHSGKMTLGEFYDFWKSNYAEKNHQPTTLVYNDFLFERIREALGKKRIDKIEPRHILQFLQNLAEPGIRKDPNEKRRKVKPKDKPESERKPIKDTLSAGTIKKHLALLSALFNKAIQWNMLPYNPAERVEPPKVERQPKEIYNQEELSKFLVALEGEEIKYQLMILLALSGGLRREEMFGLCWHHVDLDNNTVHIEQASVYVPGKTITKETKTTGSNRLISIPASVTALLKKHKAAQLAKRLKLGGIKSKGGKWEGSAEPEDDFVFVQWNGVKAHPHSFNTWLGRFIEAKRLPHITPHAFRHMAATFLIANGVDVRTVSGKLGHAQTSTTMNIYSHLLKTAEQETADTMETFLTETTALAKNKNKQAN